MSGMEAARPSLESGPRASPIGSGETVCKLKPRAKLMVADGGAHEERRWRAAKATEVATA